jgi:hypothetical protein
MAGLMLLCGPRPARCCPDVADIDIGGRRLRVTGKGAKLRRFRLTSTWPG